CHHHRALILALLVERRRLVVQGFPLASLRRCMAHSVALLVIGPKPSFIRVLRLVPNAHATARATPYFRKIDVAHRCVLLIVRAPCNAFRFHKDSLARRDYSGCLEHTGYHIDRTDSPRNLDRGDSCSAALYSGPDYRRCVARPSRRG